MPNEPSKTLTISLNTSFLGEYRFKIENDLYEINQLEFDANLRIEIPRMPLVQAAKYLSQPLNSSNEEVFVELGRWQGNDDDLIKEIIVMAIPKKNQENKSA